jgi:hypothetical protein
MKKILSKLSLKEEKVVNRTTGKKTLLKKVVGLLGLVAFVTLCVINFKIGSADYNQKSRVSLLTLEALATESSGSEVATCLQIHVAEQGKRRTAAVGYCHRTVNGVDTYEGALYNCTSKNATSSNDCNKTTCKSETGCFVTD